MKQQSSKAWVYVVVLVLVGAIGATWAIRSDAAERESLSRLRDIHTQSPELGAEAEDGTWRERGAITLPQPPRLASGTPAMSAGGAPPPGFPNLSADEVMAMHEEELDRHEQYLHGIVLDQEPDVSWESMVLDSLRAVQDSMVSSATVRSVQCGRSLCEIVIAHTGPDEHRELHFAAMDHPAFSGASLVRRRNVGQGYESTLIMARPGEVLPRVHDEAVPSN